MTKKMRILILTTKRGAAVDVKCREEMFYCAACSERRVTKSASSKLSVFEEAEDVSYKSAILSM